MFALCSCQNNNDSIMEEGAIMIDANIEDAIAVRSSEIDPLKANAQVNIYLPDYGGLVRKYTYSQMPNYIYLPSGNGYRVDVYAGERVATNPEIASFDKKSYKGSANFSVEAGKVNNTPILVTANICNAITNVTFGNGIEDAFEDGYKLTIGLDGENLEYNASNGGKDGYFIVADDADESQLDWNFTGTLTKGGEAFSKSGNFKVEQGKKYLVNIIYTEWDGTLKLGIRVDKSTQDVNDSIIFEPMSTGVEKTQPYEIWATHTTLHAVVDLSTYQENAYFEYRVAGTEGEWIQANRTTDFSEAGEFSAKVSDLTPNTTYEYRLVVTEKQKDDGSQPNVEYMPSNNTITTSVAPIIPNGSFENTSNAGKYTHFFDPNSSDSEMWWDTGNEGSTSIGSSGVIAYSDESTAAVGNKSVRLESKFVVVKFAAGNLFCGRFGEVSGMDGGTVYFGRPFTGRPTKMKFYVKYTTSTADNYGTKLQQGNYDICQAKVALGDWESSYTKKNENVKYPLLVDTRDENTFVDFNSDPSTIAYGDFQIQGTSDITNYKATINGSDESGNWSEEWREVVLDLEYSDLTRIPTHVVISFAASKWGDYFEGSTSSKMWIDGLEFIYDDDVTTK